MAAPDFDLEPGSKGSPLAVGDDAEPSAVDRWLSLLILAAFIAAVGFAGSVVGAVRMAYFMSEQIDSKFTCQPKEVS